MVLCWAIWLRVKHAGAGYFISTCRWARLRSSHCSFTCLPTCLYTKRVGLVRPRCAILMCLERSWLLPQPSASYWGLLGVVSLPMVGVRLWSLVYSLQQACCSSPLGLPSASLPSLYSHFISYATRYSRQMQHFRS